MLKGSLSEVYESESISLKKNVLKKNRKKYDVIAGVGNMAKTKETSLRISLCSINSSVMCFSDWRFLQSPTRILIQQRNISPPLGFAGSATASVQQHEQCQMAAILSLILYYVVHGWQPNIQSNILYELQNGNWSSKHLVGCFLLAKEIRCCNR